MPATPLRTLLLTLGCAVLASPLRGQHHDGPVFPPPGMDAPMPLHDAALGSYTRPIATDDPTVQAYFDQGMQLMYAFAKTEAIRSFREAHRRDSTCAACYWGEAWAWGSYLNGALAEEEAPYALAALRRAEALADEANPVERALIEALGARYVEAFDPETRAVQDTAYARAMQAVYEAFPDDPDVATLYADALFLLEPRRGTRDLDDPDVQRLHRVLEGVLDGALHPGACHLYIHATESTPAPGKAEACADYVGTAIPGASHINHMPSHTYNEIGRWGDGVRANLRAWHSDQKAAHGEGIAIYPAHNLHMLAFAASMDGQGAIAMQAGRDFARMTGNPMLQHLTYVRFGRFEELLALDDDPEGDIPRGMWNFARGYAHLRVGDADFAGVYLERVRQTADTSHATFRFHEARHLLHTVAGILEGELRRAGGDLDAAIAAFERAAAVEDSLEYDEPEPLPFAARHWLGAALLEAGRFAEAEAVYRAELADHPRNGWSLFGLREALHAQGKPAESIEADLAEAWARSDTWLRGSRL